MKNWNKDCPAKNPFDTANNATDGYENGGPPAANNVSYLRRGRSNSAAAPLQTPTSLFPPWLSSWMVMSSSPPKHTNTPDDDDDDDEVDDESDSFHDCLSKIDSMEDSYSISSYEEEETTSLLRNNQSTLQSKTLYNSISSTPLRSNTTQTHNGDDLHLQHHDTDSTAVPLSPLVNVISWISPYGRGRETKNAHMENKPNKKNGGQQFSYSKTIRQTPKSTVKFEQNSRRRNVNNNNTLTALQRAMSSPALMSMTPLKVDDDQDDEKLRQQRRSNSIVLKEIDTDFGNDSDDVLHPWTKLILLEELGTAWSWFVLLLPYAFMILAVILDGDPQLKNTTVGPLSGNNTCANVANGSIPSMFDVSAKGNFPVPFPFDSTSSYGSCSYPFELREGVGLLAHGMSPEFNSTILSSASSSIPSGKSSIVDGRYRHLMPHGSAFTSGVISDVPATSQYLQGVAKFNDLSNEAVAMVARGSVLVSAIVFQRQSQDVPGSTTETIPTGSIGIDVQQWSPVLILNPKQLDMFCKLRQRRRTSNAPIELMDPIRWDCTSRHIVDAFFSLPNTAVLIGGDLRVDVLLSYRVPRTLMAGSASMDEEFATDGIHDDDFSYDSNVDATLSEAEKILSIADESFNHKVLLAEISERSVYKLEHESVTYENVVEITRIIAFVVTLAFLCYWYLSMIAIFEDPSDSGTNNDAGPVHRFKQKWHFMWKQINESYFWWESPWVTFPERRYLQLLLLCLILLQNPLLSYAYFHPALYSSTKFRCIADSLSGISIQGVLFLWLSLVHGLRYQ